MTQFQEQKRFSARPSKSYWIQASDEEDEEFIEAAYIPFEQVDTPTRHKHIRNFHRSQDYDSIKKQFEGRLFEDNKFPASNRLLSDNGQGQIIHYFISEMEHEELFKISCFKWFQHFRTNWHKIK